MLVAVLSITVLPKSLNDGCNAEPRSRRYLNGTRTDCALTEAPPLSSSRTAIALSSRWAVRSVNVGRGDCSTELEGDRLERLDGVLEHHGKLSGLRRRLREPSLLRQHGPEDALAVEADRGLIGEG